MIRVIAVCFLSLLDTDRHHAEKIVTKSQNRAQTARIAPVDALHPHVNFVAARPALRLLDPTAPASPADAPLVLIANPSPDVYGSDLQMLETVTAVRDAGYRVKVALPSDGPLVTAVARTRR